MPTTWDDTQFAQGQVGKYITVARRKSNEWYIGTMTNKTARHVKVPLDFLGDGQFTARIWSDNPNGDPNAVIERTMKVSSKDPIPT